MLSSRLKDDNIAGEIPAKTGGYRMKINEMTPVYFDIETTGFSAWEDEFVCSDMTSDILDEQYELNVRLEGTIRRLAYWLAANGYSNTIIVTWNGENYRGGFDFPWLRSKCIQKGLEWRLSGVKHLDLLPLVRKYINTTHYVAEIPSKSSLRAGDLKELAEINNFEYQNKNQAYKKMMEIEENTTGADWNYLIETKSKEDNSLQAVYQMMFDPKCEEEYIKGGKIPELYEKIQELEKYEAAPDLSMHNKEEFRGLWQQIKDHNRRDVERLKKIAEAVVPVIPDWEIKRNINKL